MPTTFNEFIGMYGEDYMDLWCAHWVACPSCGGDGGCEKMPAGPHDTGIWIECRHCCGTGCVTTESAGIEHTETK